ncbi:hypothetical protein [Mycobacterium sp. URHB0044]|jgi:hypothetical protein|uniref:hypothetical protein n=1 Tax=Mycobacterium sp. URHB0044 TaxID=1380386 RepID=UPI00055A9231|nr:hypothetical protein [Mycobacterium sp. URHB0044]
MRGSHDDRVGQRQPALPRAAGGSINGHRMLLGIVLLLIAIASITGVFVALSSGQWQVALIIGLLSAAFFARVGC